jgi:hypothetical protein
VRGASLLAAATVVAALVAAPTAGAATVPARSAADFRDSIGVQTHIVYYDTAYGDWPRVVQKLDELGVDHVRDGMYANPASGDWNERYYQAVDLAVAHGKRFLFNMGEPGFGQGSLDQLVAAAAGRLRGAADGFEGPNEYDLFHGGPNWQGELGDYQRRLYRAIKAEPLLRDLPVVGPSLVYDDADGRLGSLKDSVDIGNIHPYTGGEAPSANHLQKRFDAVDHVFGSAPLYATEAGFHNAYAADHGQPAVAEDVAGSYLLRTYLEHFRAGISRTYAYELIDQKADPGLSNPEEHFGLLRNDFTPKPAFASLQAMLRLIGRPAAVAPQPLDLGIGGDADGVQRLLLQKADGRYTLALWQSASEWDTQRQIGLRVPSRTVSLTLPADASVTLARPARDGDAVTSLGRVRAASIAVPADPVLVDLDFSPAAAGPGPGAPSADPVAPATPADACTPGDGVVLRKAGVAASISSRASRARPFRVGFCSPTAGKVVIETGPRGRGGKIARVLAREALNVSPGVPVSTVLGSGRLAKASAGSSAAGVRVRFRARGARHEIVIDHSLDVSGVRRRASHR